MDCHCGTGRQFEECCEPHLTGMCLPATSEALMRARYSAHVIGNMDYLIATHDPATSGKVNRESIQNWAAEADWKRLQIVATADGGADDGNGVVEFIAWFEVGGRLRWHHERSTFRRIEGAWVYVGHAKRLVDPKPPKIGRNEPCPCGSGKKYKKCHGG